MLLKRLPNLPPHVAELLPLLDPRVLTTEQVVLTPRPVLLDIISASLNSIVVTTGAGAESGANGTGEGGLSSKPSLAETTAALDDLLGICLARIPVENGALPGGDELEWAGFGVLEDVLPWDGKGVLGLAGGRGTGKSLLALHATLRVLASDESATARWVDTEGAFNAGRAKAVLEVLGVDDTVLDRLTVSSMFRLEPELFDVLAQVRDDASVRVLVVDNAAALFRDALMPTTAQGHAAMVIAMEEIGELTHARNLLTIVTNAHASSVPSNPLSSFSTTTVKPALGASFAFGADIEVLLQDTSRVFGLADEGERDRQAAPGMRVVAEVLKSRVSPSGVWGVFETDGTALFDVEPPPDEDEATRLRSAGAPTGRPATGFLGETLAPAVMPLREGRR